MSVRPAALSEMIAKVPDKRACKSYVYSSEIPHIFESLLTGLIYHQPENHLRFLRNCLGAIQDAGGVHAIRWNSFIETNQSETSMPIVSGIGSRSGSSRKSATGSRTPSTTAIPSARSSRLTSGKESTKNLKEKEHTKSGKERTTSSFANIPTEMVPLPRRLLDTGRKSDLSQAAPIILAYVGPILLKGTTELRGLPANAEVIGIYNKGFTDPDDAEDDRIREELLFKLYGSQSSNPIVLLNWPRTSSQLQWLLSRVGGITSAVFVDRDEEIFRKRLETNERGVVSAHAVHRGIEIHRMLTLPVIHWLDRNGKLLVIEAFNDDDINDQLFNFFGRHFELSSATPSESLMKTPQPMENAEIVPLVDPIPEPKGIKTSLYLLYVGPVTNIDPYKAFLGDKVTHLLDNTNATDKLLEILPLNDGPIVCLNFPADRAQFDWFLANIGIDLSDVIVIDISEVTIRTRLTNAQVPPEEVEDVVRLYKKNIIPIIHWFDRAGKVFVVNGEEEEDDVVMKNVVTKISEQK